MRRALGQPVVVENQSGGGGVVGSLATARAAPDGYTLMVGYVGTHGTNPAVRKLPYDAVKDFTPIAMVGGTPNVLVVPPSLPVEDAARNSSPYAKANPGKLSYGSSGPGTLTHLAMEQFKVAADLDIVHVPYRGIGPAITDILGGQTQALFPGLAAALPHIKAGKMRPLAVTGHEAPSAAARRADVRGARASRASTACSGTASSARRTCRAPIVKHAERRDQQDARRSGAARAAVRRGAGADADDARRSSAQYIRDDIARWTKLAKERNIAASTD